MATTAITSPKKRSLMPSGNLRRTLRGHGHAMSPVVQVGKAGVTEALLRQLRQALADHELIKIAVSGESPMDRFEVADRFAAEPGVSIVQILGRTILAYKRHPNTPRYEGKRAEAAAPTRTVPTTTYPDRRRSAPRPAPVAWRAENSRWPRWYRGRPMAT